MYEMHLCILTTLMHMYANDFVVDLPSGITMKLYVSS